MAERLMMTSIDTDNRITANFSDKYLPRYGRHGELYVVDGILYIYADLDNSNHGKWFPLSNEKEIYTYAQDTPAIFWNIPIDFQTDNVQLIVYDATDKIFAYDYTVDIDERIIRIVFEEETSGTVHLIINKAFDWVDRRFIVADRNFAVTEDKNNINKYYLEIFTEYVKVLKNGNTTFKSDFTIGGRLNVGTITNVNKLVIDASTVIKSNLEIDGDVWIKGNTIIEGDFIVKGNTTTVNTTEISLSNNILILNSDVTGEPILSASIDINRGSEGVLSMIRFDEVTNVVTIPAKQLSGVHIQTEIADKVFVNDSILLEKTRAEAAELVLTNSHNTEVVRLNEEIARAKMMENALQNDVNARALDIDTYNKMEVDNIVNMMDRRILDAVPTPEETLYTLKQADGIGSGLDADLLDGLDSSKFNQVLGLNVTITTSGAEVIESLTLENGVITGYTTRIMTLHELGYSVEQPISTVTSLQNIINMLTKRIESLEAKS